MGSDRVRSGFSNYGDAEQRGSTLAGSPESGEVAELEIEFSRQD